MSALTIERPDADRPPLFVDPTGEFRFATVPSGEGRLEKWGVFTIKTDWCAGLIKVRAGNFWWRTTYKDWTPAESFDDAARAVVEDVTRKVGTR